MKNINIVLLSICIILLIILISLISKKNKLSNFTLNKYDNFDNFENVIMTTYFCKKIDPQRLKISPCNDIIYIKPWYYSIKKLGLNGIIFHDGMSDSFIKKYETDKIKFIYVDSNDYDYSLNDLRYFVYYDYILKNKNIKNVFMTDGNDVTIVNNPFVDKLLNKVCVGKELEKLYKKDWMLNKIKQFNKIKGLHFNKNKETIYNAGLLGGKRENILRFLENMLYIFDSLSFDQKKQNLNMIVFNYVVYNHLNENVISGEILHSKYKKFENDRKDIYFIHK
tara:strand:+ start:6202 stop:7041 length:840 start_codon:yes stop_codon:yes gene_type:complete